MSDAFNSDLNLQGRRAKLPVSGSRALVIGLGLTGLSCTRFLVDLGVEVAIADTRDIPPQLDTLKQEFPDIALFLGGFPLDPIVVPDLIVVSPGVSIAEPFIQQCVARGSEVVGDIELFARALDAPVIAITGSNGKSTVTSLLGHMASRSKVHVEVGGNIGVPVLELLKRDRADLYVLELSSFQLETTTSLNAVVATVLNLSPDHLDRYEDMSAYVNAKRRVFHGDGVMVLNADDTGVKALAELGRDVRWFGLSEPSDDNWGLRQVEGENWISVGSEALMPVSNMRLAGTQNVSNALAALALGEIAGLDRPAMLATLREFSGLAHRMQWVAERDGVSFFNDSKATNVGATLAALEGLSGKAVLIAGGDCKGADLSTLAGVISRKARAVVLMGRDAGLIEQIIPADISVFRVDDMQSAVEQANHVAKSGDTVLLSPACASLDMFRNFEERGQCFIDAVERVLS